MIIEFNGLPGTGKTTVAKALGNECMKQGMEICYNYEMNESWLKRHILYLFDGTLVVSYYARKMIKNDIVPYGADKYEYIGCLLKYYRMYKKFGKADTRKILIIDQGIVQSLISIAHMESIEKTTYLTRLFRYFEKQKVEFICVSCESNSRLSSERIVSRNQDGGRLDKLRGHELEGALDRQTENFGKVRSCLTQTMKQIFNIVIDTEKTPESNADFVLQEMVDFMRKNNEKSS